ncbi:hypothetical protein MHUMG1_05445 [Metarhizium humberi]|uniref:Uncharacterized protein n=1 Tax=Metarhizium humberi TaxID=2596975 RepID=A0A9P8MAH4_9HYPO|nr:hypothetical protein MHUMG1_05445 [Metarhizium humberi]
MMGCGRRGRSTQQDLPCSSLVIQRRTVVDHISLPASDLDEVKCTYSNIGVFNGARDDTRRRMPMPTLFQSMANGGYLAPNRWDVAFWSTGERPSETSMARAHAGQLAAMLLQFTRWPRTPAILGNSNDPFRSPTPRLLWSVVPLQHPGVGCWFQMSWHSRGKRQPDEQVGHAINAPS